MKPMIANEGLRRNWRRNWLSSIQELADDHTQRRLWLDRNVRNPHYSFVECLSCYFDGLAVFDDPATSGHAYAVAQAQGLVSADEAFTVEPLHAIFDAYEAPGNNQYDHQAILTDPKWEEVVAAAKFAQAALLPMLHDPEERRILTEVSPSAVQA